MTVAVCPETVYLYLSFRYDHNDNSLTKLDDLQGTSFDLKILVQVFDCENTVGDAPALSYNLP